MAASDSCSKRVSAALLSRNAVGAGLVPTLLSFGANRLVGRAAAWLHARGLLYYVLPLLLANEAFGAWRAYLAGSAMGWW